MKRSIGRTSRRRLNGQANKLSPEDRPVHDWYRFVLSFPPHLVRDFLERFNTDRKCRVLDPFCGTGTTLVECKKNGITAIGVERTPMGHFASQVKTDWAPEPDGLLNHARKVADSATAELAFDGIEDVDTLPRLRKNINNHRSRQLRTLPPEKMKLLLRDSISPLPLHKTLVLLDCLEQDRDKKYYRHELLALANAVVSSISNLHFGPEVGIGPPKADVPVVWPWLSEVDKIARDLGELEVLEGFPTAVHIADARQVSNVVKTASIDAVITSPPYPNEKDYTRTTRLESVLLGFLRDQKELRALKQGLVRSNTRGVYKADDDDQWIVEHPKIQRIANAIEQRRTALGKTSGFERLYHRVTKLYFGGMARHLADLRTVLKPGAQLAFVVGDQASYLRVMIRTGQLLTEIAESLGYEPVSIDLFRTRLSTATKQHLREEVVVLRWPGRRRSARPVSAVPKMSAGRDSD